MFRSVLVFLLLLPVTAQARQIAVLQLQVEGGADPVIGNQMTSRLAEIIGKRGHKVIAPDDVRALLEQETQKQLLGCSDDSCLSEIAGALGVDAIVSGRVSKVEGGFAISLSLVDSKSAQALAHESETWRGESIALLELVPPMIDKLFGERGKTLTGSIEVEGAAAGSRILLDDQIRGTAPAGQMANIPVGARKLQVIAEDYQPFERWVVVKTNEVTTVPIDQQAVPSAAFYQTWWFWSLAAAGVAGTAVGAAFLLKGDNTNTGQTGVNVAVNADGAFTGGR